ncbi:MAG: pyridoxamine 5'-phosphate oxidase family protein [Pseudomonadota bacterium]
MDKKDVIRPTDDGARQEAQSLLAGASHAALAVIEPASGTPMATRIALALDTDGAPMTLVSDLSPHTGAMRTEPRASLLVGEPGPKGDPLAYPRLTVSVSARFIAPDDPERPAIRSHWLSLRPKTKLYIDFADFHLVQFEIQSAALNGGFGKAFLLTAADLLVTN